MSQLLPIEKLQLAAASIRELPPEKKPEPTTISRYQLVCQLREHLNQKRQQGCSWNYLVNWLTELGINITPTTLANYLAKANREATGQDSTQHKKSKAKGKSGKSKSKSQPRQRAGHGDELVAAPSSELSVEARGKNQSLGAGLQSFSREYEKTDEQSLLRQSESKSEPKSELIPEYQSGKKTEPTTSDIYEQMRQLRQQQDATQSQQPALFNTVNNHNNDSDIEPETSPNSGAKEYQPTPVKRRR